MLFPLWLALATAAQSSTATPFRTTVNPRIDPVFGDVTVLRRTVDRFLALQVEMDQVRNEFSTAVHSTLAEVTRPAGRGENRFVPAQVQDFRAQQERRVVEYCIERG